MIFLIRLYCFELRIVLSVGTRDLEYSCFNLDKAILEHLQVNLPFPSHLLAPATTAQSLVGAKADPILKILALPLYRQAESMTKTLR